MANKLDRIKKGIQKVKSKIAEYNKLLQELEGQKTEQENLQIIQLARDMRRRNLRRSCGVLQTVPTLTPCHEKKNIGHEIRA